MYGYRSISKYMFWFSGTTATKNGCISHHNLHMGVVFCCNMKYSCKNWVWLQLFTSACRKVRPMYLTVAYDTYIQHLCIVKVHQHGCKSEHTYVHLCHSCSYKYMYMVRVHKSITTTLVCIPWSERIRPLTPKSSNLKTVRYRLL